MSMAQHTGREKARNTAGVNRRVVFKTFAQSAKARYSGAPRAIPHIGEVDYR